MIISSKVSVVLITYKRPERLAHAINTVVKQAYQNIELLVVDGANSVKNQAVVNSFINNTKVKNTKKKIKYVPVEPEAVNMFSQYGMQHSRNVGCKKATGKYIAMLDDDDSWSPDKIEKQISVFNDKDKIGLVTCYNKIISDNKETVDKPRQFPEYSDLLESFNLSSTSTFLFKRQILEEIGFWNEKLRGMHEYYFALKLTKLGYKIFVYPEPLMIKEWTTVGKSINQKGSYFYIKIAEVMDFWSYFGSDAFSVLSAKLFLKLCIKTVILFMLYILGYFVDTLDLILKLKNVYRRRIINE